MQFLAAWCALGNRRISVANGKEKGSDMSKIIHKAKEGDVFLDNRTGDFYAQIDENSWEVQGNVGLHLAQALDSKETKASKTPMRFVEPSSQAF